MLTLLRDQQPLKMLDNPLYRFAVPFRRNRASAGGWLLGSVAMSSLVPIMTVAGRSVLSRRVRR